MIGTVIGSRAIISLQLPRQVSDLDACLAALEASGVDIRAPAEERPEQGNLGFREGLEVDLGRGFHDALRL